MRSWKEDMEQRLLRIEQALLAGPETNLPNNADSNPPAASQSLPSRTDQHSSSDNAAMLDLSCSLGAFPASSITNVRDDVIPAFITLTPPDFISRGIVSTAWAKEQLDFFKQYLDPFIHYALDHAMTLSDIRARSSLLAAVVCAVVAMCTRAEQYVSCLEVVREEVTRRLFADNNTFDHVLACCIGALWLRDIASIMRSQGK